VRQDRCIYEYFRTLSDYSYNDRRRTDHTNILSVNQFIRLTFYGDPRGNLCDTNFRTLLLFIRIRPTAPTRIYIGPDPLACYCTCTTYSRALLPNLQVLASVLLTTEARPRIPLLRSSTTALREPTEAYCPRALRPSYSPTACSDYGRSCDPTGLLYNLTCDHTRLFGLRKAYDPTGLRPYGPRPSA